MPVDTALPMTRIPFAELRFPPEGRSQAEIQSRLRRHYQRLRAIREGIEPPPRDFWYIHIMCDNHDLVLAEGAVAETLYLGRMARSALPPEALADILRIFPELAETEAPEPACMLA